MIPKPAAELQDSPERLIPSDSGQHFFSKPKQTYPSFKLFSWDLLPLSLKTIFITTTVSLSGMPTLVEMLSGAVRPVLALARVNNSRDIPTLILELRARIEYQLIYVLPANLTLLRISWHFCSKCTVNKRLTFYSSHVREYDNYIRDFSFLLFEKPEARRCISDYVH